MNCITFIRSLQSLAKFLEKNYLQTSGQAIVKINPTDSGKREIIVDLRAKAQVIFGSDVNSCNNLKNNQPQEKPTSSTRKI